MSEFIGSIFGTLLFFALVISVVGLGISALAGFINIFCSPINSAVKAVRTLNDKL